MNDCSDKAHKLSVRQHTVGRSEHWHGVRRQRRAEMLVVHPAEADTGVRFMRHGESAATGMIPAHWDSVVETNGGIVLGNAHGVTLHGAIPLLAALRVAGIDNAVVEVYGPRLSAEVGDFEFYLGKLADVGTQTQIPARRLQHVIDTIEIRDRFGFLRLSPDTRFRACVNVTTAVPGARIGSVCALLRSDFTEPDVAFNMARCWPNEQEPDPTGDTGVRRSLRTFRALPNALQVMVVGMIGHLALAGAPVACNVYVDGSGPRLYQALLRALMERGAVALTTVDAYRIRPNSTIAKDAG
jgi:UDP-3-O-acyl-N-acetylglucosamine deacetylase